MSQDIYSTIWVKHNDNTSERIVLSEAYKGSTQFGDAVFTKFINENDRSLEYFCRMDGKKMIRYDVDKGAEYTLYDFGLDEGELFETPDGRTMQVVEKGDTVFSEGMPTFHFLKLVNTESTDDTDIWIENYGSLYTSVLQPSELGNDVKESHLLFDWVGPLANVFRSESIQSQMMSIEKVTGYVIYDETNGNLEYIPDSLHCGFTADTLVISGRLQRAGTAFHYLSCELVNDTIRFRVDDLPDSAFTQTSKMYYFTAKFPGFKPGTYIVNYHDDNISVDGINIEVVCEYIDRGMFKEGYVWAYTGCSKADAYKYVGCNTAAYDDFYECIGTKTINGREYYLLFCERGNIDSNYSKTMTSTDTDVSPIICIREEEGRVYVLKEEYLNILNGNNFLHREVGDATYCPYKENDEGELVLYDFTMNVGDRFLSVDGHDDIYVEAVDMVVTSKGESRRRLTLNNGYVIMEGIGCINSPGMFICYLNPKTPEDIGFLLGCTSGYTQDFRLYLDVKDIPVIQSDSSGYIYDLSGRRLNTPPEQGIYIQDGKKFIK